MILKIGAILSSCTKYNRGQSEALLIIQRELMGTHYKIEKSSKDIGDALN